MGIAYGDSGYGDKLSYFAMDFQNMAPTTDERMNGTAYLPTGLTTTYGVMGCTNTTMAHYTRSGRYYGGASIVGFNRGTVFGQNLTTNMSSVSRRSFGFTDAWPHSSTASSMYGVDDYQDGWSCSDAWGPKEIRGARMVVLVR